MLDYYPHITRELVKSRPGTLFVFGDNLKRSGLGGQAKEMRHAPNAVGIPTKKFPGMKESHFFNDSNGDFYLWMEASLPNLNRLLLHAANSQPIIWPLAGIGSGRAQLHKRAPRIYKVIFSFEGVLKECYREHR